MHAVAAVVGGDDGLVAGGADVVLQDDQVLVPRADDGHHAVAGFLHGLGDGVGHGDAYSPAHRDDRAELLDVGGHAERSRDVHDGVALLQGVQVPGRFADGLDDQRDRAGLRVGVGDGQGDSLTLFVGPQNDELAGLSLAGDDRGFHFEAANIFRKHLLLHYVVHVLPLIGLLCRRCRMADSPSSGLGPRSTKSNSAGPTRYTYRVMPRQLRDLPRPACPGFPDGIGTRRRQPCEIPHAPASDRAVDGCVSYIISNSHCKRESKKTGPAARPVGSHHDDEHDASGRQRVRGARRLDPVQSSRPAVPDMSELRERAVVQFGESRGCAGWPH